MTLKQEYAEFFKKEMSTKMTPIGYQPWLEQQVLDLRNDRKKLYALAWEQHQKWAKALIDLTVEKGLPAADRHLVMTDEDRESNTRFTFYMIDNPGP